MLNIAIIAACLLSAVFAPGQRLVGLLLGTPMLQSLPPGQGGLILALAGYWLPAALLYLALRTLPGAARFTPTRVEAVILGVCNAVLVAFVAARVYGSTVQGGGAGIVLGLVAVVTAWPALVIGALVLLQAVIRGLSAAGRQAVQNARATDRRLSTAEIVTLGLVGFGPVVYLLGTLFLGQHAPYQMARTANQRLTALCPTAGEHIVRIPTGVEGLYLSNDWSADFSSFTDGVYANSNFAVVGEPFVNSGWLRFYETPLYGQTKTTTSRPRYQRYFYGQPTQVVDHVSAQWGVFRNALTTPDDEGLGTVGIELVVKVLATDEVLATKRYVYNWRTHQICGYGTGTRLADSEFIIRALGLARRFPSAWK
jgi:hypothetical protein